MIKQSRCQKFLRCLYIILCVGIMVGLPGHVFATNEAHARTEVEKLWIKIYKLEKELKATQKATAPVGTILPYGGSEEPKGWLFCDGRELRRDKYKDLYEVIRTDFCKNKEAPSNETFCLPDLRGRVAVAAGSGQNLAPRTLGDKGGEEEHRLTIPEMPEHFHYIPTRGLGGRQPKEKIWALQATTKGDYKPHERETDKKGGNQAHENMPPFLVVNYIIKY